MTTQEHLSTIDALVVEPFPEAPCADATGSGGPQHHIRVLQVSRDFWDDDDGRAWVQAEAGLMACLDDLAARLTTRWGDAFVVDLGPFLSAALDGESVPEPLDDLSQQVVSMRVWPLPDGDRWLALAVGQADKELPLILYAAIGRACALDLNVVSRSGAEPNDEPAV
ncbi:hypothetical protein OG599_01940 [Streptomyces sp. NBC_01335]|uniref:hypothetical protein n=1 Tax=Streptomyces sp. NBC_01335 TaxID=2903828 RepID=UPI002E1345CD|nr:hypothetical protein OG599_01940 [Streptomyces sp. NBC_01335]